MRKLAEFRVGLAGMLLIGPPSALFRQSAERRDLSAFCRLRVELSIYDLERVELLAKPLVSASRRASEVRFFLSSHHFEAAEITTREKRSRFSPEYLPNPPAPNSRTTQAKYLFWQYNLSRGNANQI